MITEADTCRKYVLPKFYSAGWNDDQISEQKTFTDGRIVIVGEKCNRKKQKRSDYLLRLRRDFTIAVVEAKAAYKKSGDGLQKAKEYAEILGLKFAYSTNGKGIVEHDYLTGKDTDLDGFPSPDELWARLSKSERRIVAYLDSLQAKVDALRRLQTETSAELDAMMPSVLDKAFKGEMVAQMPELSI
jgi:type I restriction enzyme R subunit